MRHDKMETVIEEIIDLNTALGAFWSNSSGWAPERAADLMSKSRLDRQISLSKCLTMWSFHKGITQEDGALILAWSNLGRLIEGTLKLFLAVYYDDYQKDIEAFKDKKGRLQDPDGLPLDKLRVFFNKKKLWLQYWDRFVLQDQN